jgi:hypothetical protein
MTTAQASSSTKVIASAVIRLLSMRGGATTPMAPAHRPKDQSRNTNRLENRKT